LLLRAVNRSEIAAEKVARVYYGGSEDGLRFDLHKRGIAIRYTDRVMNPKEATIAPVADGTWRLFFEYAESGASKVGIASLYLRLHTRRHG